MISTPLFSILIANYNNGQYLEECLQSVFAQTYRNWEIILVDDASTDGKSQQIYEKYKNHKQIRIFYNQENKGCGYTKRRCADEANGEICGFLDPDDVITPDAIEKMILEHKKNPSCSIIYSNHFYCNDLLQIKYDATGRALYGTSAFATYRNIKYKLTDGINPDLKKAIDHDLYQKLEEEGQSLIIDHFLYYYRQHNNSISLNENWLNALYWSIKVKKDTYKRRKKKRYPNIKKSEIKQLELHYLIAMSMKKLNSKEYKMMYIFLFRALKHIYYDKRFSILRISIAPLKFWK